uniref:Uncharacterized protein n=1 Tax=Plectus sambesii TaxID=2011161 RepID=A0A914XNK2_9BILA
MGAWLSRLQTDASDFADFEKRTPEKGEMFQTPTATATGRSRVLNTDPRSPTASINRTPIEVESTPKRLMSVDSDASAIDSPSIPLLKKPKDSLHKRVLEKRLPLATRNFSDSPLPADSN